MISKDTFSRMIQDRSLWMYCLAWAIVFVVVLMLIIVGRDNPDYTARGFPKLEQSEEIFESAIEDLQQLRVNGEMALIDWVDILDGELIVWGFSSGDSDGGFPQAGLSKFTLIIPEVVDSFRTYRFMTFYTSDETKISSLSLRDKVDIFDSETYVANVDSDWESDKHSDLLEGDLRLTRLSISIHDGWVHAETVHRSRNAYLATHGDRLLRSAGYTLPSRFSPPLDNERYWLDIWDDEQLILEGLNAGGAAKRFNDGTAEATFVQESDYDAIVNLVIPSRIGAASIYGLARVYFLDEGVENFFDSEIDFWEGGGLSIPVQFLDSKLIYAGKE